MYKIRRPPGQNLFCSLNPSCHRTSKHTTQHDCCCFLPMPHGIPLITVNAIVCVLGSNCRLHRASSYLLFSLAIADLIVTLVCTPLPLEIISHRIFFHSHECTASLERAFGILSHVSCTTSVFHMVAISFDRFPAVVFPLRHNILIRKCGLKATPKSWTIPIPPHFKAYRSTGSLSRQIYWTGIFCLHLLLYFFIYFFFYFLIVLFLLHHRKTRKQLGTRTVSVKLTTAGRYELLAQ